MPKKKTTAPAVTQPAAEVRQQPITETVEKNFMPYAMSVIVSRAIPEIDGFKPAHRKLLYTMYKMGLLTGAKTKSANVVGQTMRLNPHGDAAIYETLVRLTRGNETLLHPFIDSKGSFGKHYSSSMVYAASRYTECKLDPFCAEIFGGIEHDAVDMCDNYDGTMLEPVLFPTSFPNILLSPNKGIAVAMSSSICSFNLAELCDATVQMLLNPDTTVDQLLDILIAPDFQGGGYINYNRETLREIYRTGHGSVRLRARWRYDKDQNCIDIVQIPYSTTVELISSKLTQLIKEGKIKEITDFRDETDIGGFRLTLDLRRGVDPDKLMTKLYKSTPLEDSFDCNFNVLIDGAPRLLGVGDILTEWIRFRMNCVRRELSYDLSKMKARLHLLQGLGKIILDIDKAIKIIRGTEHDADVIPNLCAGFDIDEDQAEFVAEIKLRNINREYLLSRMKDIRDLEEKIASTEEIISSERKLKGYIAKQLREIKSKYAKPRQTQLIYEDELVEPVLDEPEDTTVNHVMFTREGYFKKVSMRSLKATDSQKLKEGDEIEREFDATDSDELLFFSDHAQVYKAHVRDFDLLRSGELGDYVPAKLDFDSGERAVAMCRLERDCESHSIVLVYENGACVRIPASAYSTKSNRRKLTGGYSDHAPLVAVFYVTEPIELLLRTEFGKGIVFDSSAVAFKTTRTSRGAIIINLKKGDRVISATTDLTTVPDAKRLRKTKLPASGVGI